MALFVLWINIFPFIEQFSNNNPQHRAEMLGADSVIPLVLRLAFSLVLFLEVFLRLNENT